MEVLKHYNQEVCLVGTIQRSAALFYLFNFTNEGILQFLKTITARVLWEVLLLQQPRSFLFLLGPKLRSWWIKTQRSAQRHKI